MRFRLSVAFAALLVFGSATAMAATADDAILRRAAERHAFLVATVPDQLPLAARNAEGALTGFDVEVGAALAKELGEPAQFVTPGWKDILAGKAPESWDFAVASITPTPARAENISFPALYRMDAAVVVVRNDETKVERPQDVSGKTVAVKAKTTFERYLLHNLALDEGGPSVAYVIQNATIKAVPNNGDALAALVDKKADAAITSLAIAQAAKKDGMPIRVLPGFLYFEPVSVATHKGNPGFDQKIANAVETLRANGTLSALSTKWFGIDLGTIVP